MASPCLQPNIAQIALGYGIASGMTLNVGYTPIVRGAEGEFRMIPLLSVNEDPEVSAKVYEYLQQQPKENGLNGDEITRYFRAHQQEVTNVCTKWGVRAANELDDANPKAPLATNDNMQPLASQQSSPLANTLIAPGNLDISGFRQKNQANLPAASETLLNDRKGPTI